jgi:hypothetical protein
MTTEATRSEADSSDAPPLEHVFQAYKPFNFSRLQKTLDDQLCETCQTLVDLDPNSPNRSHDKVSLELPKQVCERVSCPFCRLVMMANSGGFFDHLPVSVEWMKDGHGFYAGGAGAKRLVFLNEESAVSPLGVRRVVQPKVSPELVKNWIRMCGEHHPACVPESSITASVENPSGLKILRVIDVQDECVVEMPVGCNWNLG